MTRLVAKASGIARVISRIVADIHCAAQPCTGIARLKRWKRAQRLKLNPPIEVLAVLLKAQDGNDKGPVQNSHVDELLNSRNVEPEAGA